ncbi:glycosyltransferase [Plasticicumulans acidivorans]|uniref:Glycosyltransferase involved in cell wall biosynthesis n=1 Tax=Plasticicumulans acidivorans TaxID=886464 RepID=A0A317MZC4_9GAMM|nr:glycosyltransferase [Plasticicumulans acidivorans]PWV65632.1 glycosyltransferase involved in cell wall biosynthesis [Plasticicumulans acidivorans]
MKVLLVSHADAGGGAAIAAHRLHIALQKNGVASEMLVVRKSHDDPSIVQIVQDGWPKLMAGIRRQLARRLMRLQTTSNTVLHSPAVFRTGLAEYINSTDADVVNLHWVCDETISIEEIAEIRKPIVWTLHDTWPFCGAEHYFDPLMTLRFIEGYTKKNRPQEYKGLDLDQWVWRRKIKSWKNKRFLLIAPSQWMAFQAQSSMLFKNQRIHVVSNGLDTEIFRPLDKLLCRKKWNLPADKKLILFGAASSTSDPRKGFNYLRDALNEIASKGLKNKIEAVVFGSKEKPENQCINLVTHYVGNIFDETQLATLYGAADVFVTPSMQDNLPNTLLESMSCGLPCVAFSVGGIPEIIDHGVNGYLVDGFSTKKLAESILLVFDDVSSMAGKKMTDSARLTAERRYRQDIFSNNIEKVFREAVAGS